MRHVTGLAVLVLLLSCPSGASSQQIPLLAAPPPPQAEPWADYQLPDGADATVGRFLDSIDALAGSMSAPNGAEIRTATGELRTHLFAGNDAAQTWARIMLAYRFASRGLWNACRTELNRHSRDKAPPANWINHNEMTQGLTVRTLINNIRSKNVAAIRTGVNDPTIIDVEKAVAARETGRHRSHEMIESWNRILIGWYVARHAGDTDAQWQRVKDELEHLEPSR